MTKRQNGSRVAGQTSRLKRWRLNSRPRRLSFDNPGMKRPVEIPPTNEKLLIDATDALRSTFSQNVEIPKVSRGEAETIWRAIDADVLPDAEVNKWCRIVAKRVVEEVLGFDSTETRKSDQAVQAIFLPGRARTALAPEEARDLAWTMLSAALETWMGRRKRRISYLELAKKMQDRGYFKDRTTNAVAEFLRRADKHKSAL